VLRRRRALTSASAAFVFGVSLLSGRAAWALGEPGISVPVYALDHICRDARFPALAGEWAVGCGATGLVDRAVHLPTGTVIELPVAAARPGIAPGFLYTPGAGGALFRLTPSAALQVVEDAGVVRGAPIAPPAIDGVHVAIATRDRIYVATPDASTWPSWTDDLQGWDGPALVWPWVAWVDDGMRVVAIDAVISSPPIQWSTAGTRARHVVSDGARFAWVEDGALVLLRPGTGERERIETRTGFHAPPALSGDRVCYEERVPAGGVQVRCNDGTVVGSATWPSLSGERLLYRKGDDPWLLVLAPS
jgi:hypothetical protein